MTDHKRLLPDTLPESNVEYYWKRTEGWESLSGENRWWEVFVVFHDGMNGADGAYITELWRWNNSFNNLRVINRNLTLTETRQLLSELVVDLSR